MKNGDKKEKGTSARLEALEKAKRAINGAYHDRDDYPPYKLDVFSDRAIYHQYILKLMEELIDFEKGIKTGIMSCPLCSEELEVISKAEIKGGIDEYRCNNCDINWQVKQAITGVIQLIGGEE